MFIGYEGQPVKILEGEPEVLPKEEGQEEVLEDQPDGRCGDEVPPKEEGQEVTMLCWRTSPMGEVMKCC